MLIREGIAKRVGKALPAAFLFFFFAITLRAESPPTASLPRADTSAFEKWWHSDGVLCDSLGYRQKLAGKGIILTGNLQMDVMGNVVGGNSRTATFDMGMYLYMALDLDKLAGWKGGTFQISMFDGTGRDISQRIGNVLPPSQVWVNAPTIIFYDLWLQQQIGDHFSVKAGRMSFGDDFMFLPVFNDYISGSVNTNPISILNNAPLTSCPFTAWAFNMQATPIPQWAFLAGAYQTTPRQANPNYHGLDYSIRPDNGIAAVAEADWTPTFGGEKSPSDGKQTTKQGKDAKEVQVSGLPGVYKVGAYYTYGQYSSVVSGTGNVGTYGFYWMAQQMVWQESPGSDQGLTLWGTLTLSPQQQIAQMPFFAGGGLDYKGLLPGRDADKLIFGVYYGLLSSQYVASQGRGVSHYGGSELVFEGSYRFKLNKFLYLQPDIQWIIPSASEGFANALVIGGEFGLTF